jgi:hypothetical protein
MQASGASAGQAAKKNQPNRPRGAKDADKPQKQKKPQTDKSAAGQPQKGNNAKADNKRQDKKGNKQQPEKKNKQQGGKQPANKGRTESLSSGSESDSEDERWPGPAEYSVIVRYCVTFPISALPVAQQLLESYPRMDKDSHGGWRDGRAFALELLDIECCIYVRNMGSKYSVSGEVPMFELRPGELLAREESHDEGCEQLEHIYSELEKWVDSCAEEEREDLRSNLRLGWMAFSYL